MKFQIDQMRSLFLCFFFSLISTFYFENFWKFEENCLTEKKKFEMQKRNHFVEAKKKKEVYVRRNEGKLRVIIIIIIIVIVKGEEKVE